MSETIQISEEILDQIKAEALACHPEEACGFLLGQVANEGRVAKEFVACQNIQNELHEKNPDRYPRDAKTAYVIDSKEQEGVQKKAKDSGLEIIAVVHSHPEHDAYFSKEDKENAAPWGEPLFPNLSYVVASVYGDQVKAISDFYWDNEAKDFVEHQF